MSEATSQIKPAYLMRNEKLHSAWHNDYIPTIEETIKMIDMWLNFKIPKPALMHQTNNHRGFGR